jgi:membrane protein
MQLLRLCYDIAKDSIERFNADDGWPIASHLALSALMAMFPFLIVLAGLAGFVTTLDLADAVATLMLKTWPSAVSGSIADEVREVIRVARGSVFGTGIVFAVFFSSSGIESLRIGLNRAYQVRERRSWLCVLRGPRVGHDRALVSVHRRRGLPVRRRAQRVGPAGARLLAD